jgi:hypothetical protein
MRPGRLKNPPDEAGLPGLPRPGWVTLRCIVDADGAVEVAGGAEKVREPRLPELKPPPTRASALEASIATVATTTAIIVKPRETLRNMMVLPNG